MKSILLSDSDKALGARGGIAWRRRGERYSPYAVIGELGGVAGWALLICSASNLDSSAWSGARSRIPVVLIELSAC